MGRTGLSTCLICGEVVFSLLPRLWLVTGCCWFGDPCRSNDRIVCQAFPLSMYVLMFAPNRRAEALRFCCP